MLRGAEGALLLSRGAARLPGRLESVADRAEGALLLSRGAASSYSLGREPQEPGASETLIALLVLNPSGVTWNGSRRGAGTMRCRPRWGSEMLHTRRFLGLMPQALRFRPTPGGSETITSVNGTGMIP